MSSEGMKKTPKKDAGVRYQDDCTRWVKENRHRFDDRMRLDGRDAEE